MIARHAGDFFRGAVAAFAAFWLGYFLLTTWLP